MLLTSPFVAVTRAAYKQDQSYYPLRLILFTDNVMSALIVANTLLQTHPESILPLVSFHTACR